MSRDTDGLDVFSGDYGEFSRNAATKRMHNIPRFGHTSDFSKLWGTEEEQKDYLYGLLFAGAFIAAFLLAWLIVLLILKCLPGVGFFNGSRFKRSAGSRTKIIRGTFLLSAVLVITFSVCFVTQGLTKLNNTVDTMNLSARQVQRLSTRASAIVADMKSVRDSTVSTLPSFVNQVEDFCPADPAFADLVDVDIQSIADEINTAVAQLGDQLAAELERLAATARSIQNSSTQVVNETDNIEINSWQSLAIIIPYTVITCWMILAAVLAWRGTDSRPVLCFTYWVMLPIFIVMIVFAFALSAAIAIAASGNADFCSGGEEVSPQGTIMNILRMEGLTEDDLELQLVRFYISACTETDALAEFRSYNNELGNVVEEIKAFNASLFEAGQDILSERCGEDYATSVVSSTAVLTNNLLRQAGNVVDLLLLAACDEIVPLFINTFESGTCDYSVTGVTWMFSAFLIVGVFGMFMITFRSSLLPDEALEYWDNEKALAYDDQQVQTPTQDDYDADYALPAGEESFQEDEIYISEGEQATIPPAQDQQVQPAMTPVSQQQGNPFVTAPPAQDSQPFLGDDSWLDMPPMPKK